MNIYVNKQSSIKLEGSKIVYFDPWDVSDVANADYIFISHDHFDHLDIKTVKKLLKPETKVIIPESIEIDLDEKYVLKAKACEEYDLEGINFKTIKAYNASKNFHPITKGYLGYTVKLDNETVYVTGDSDATEDAKNVKCDILLLPIGGTYTMDIPEAIELVEAIKPKLVIPTHYGDVVGDASDGKKFKKFIEEKLPDIKVEIKL